MTDVYVIRNELKHYWGKKKFWVDGGDARVVARFKHRDEAVNTLFELGSKDIDLRGEITPAKLSPRGEPMVEASDTPLPDNADNADNADNECTPETPEQADA